MASAKVMAKLQADQSSITQMAELHSKQGSNVTNSSLAKKTGLAAQRWHHSVITSQTTHRPPSSRDEKDLLKRHQKDPPSLCLHLYPTYFKFEHEDGFFSYKSQFKDFLTCIKDKRLPGDLMDVFNDASCRYYNGCLIVEIHDHRSGDPENNNRTLETEAKMKRIVMKPTAESIWTDITLLSEEWGFPWTEDIALEVEAQILIATEEPLCLDPSFQVTRVSNAIEYTNGSRKLKRKCKWNSVELEQKLAKKAENDKLMTLMDTRAKRVFPFEPSFGKISFVQDWRSKEQKAGMEPLPAIDTKKGKGRKTLVEPPTLPDGRKCCRTIRFERSEGDRKVYTIVNIYVYNGEYDGVFRWGTFYDTSVNGGNIDFQIGPEYLMETYVVHLKSTYGQFNTLVCDNSNNNIIPPSPSTVRIPTSVAQQTAQQQANYQVQQLHAQQNRAMQAQSQALAQSQSQAHMQQLQQQAAQSRASTPSQSHMSTPTISHTTPLQQAATLPRQSLALPGNGMLSQHQTPTQAQAQLSAQHMAALQQQQQQQQAAMQSMALPQRTPQTSVPTPQVSNMLPVNNTNANAGQAQAVSGMPGNMTSIQQAALAQVIGGVNAQQISPQASLQRIQQLVATGAIPLATAQQLVSQLANAGNLHRQQAAAQQQAQQQVLQAQAAQQAQLNQQSPQQRMAAGMQQQNAPQTPQNTTASQLLAQLSPQHQQQMSLLIVRRNHLAALAAQRSISQEDLQTQIRQLQQLQQGIIQQHQLQQQQAQIHAQQQQAQQQVLQQAQARAAAQAAQAAQVTRTPQVAANQLPNQQTTQMQQQQQMQQQAQQLVQQQVQQQLQQQQQQGGTSNPQLNAQQQAQMIQQIIMHRNLESMRGRGRGQVPLTPQQMVAFQAMRQNGGVIRNNNGGLQDANRAAMLAGLTRDRLNAAAAAAQAATQGSGTPGTPGLTAASGAGGLLGQQAQQGLQQFQMNL
ncbi:hypothetical protein INT48_009025, partial [Thamnidium elegans]